MEQYSVLPRALVEADGSPHKGAKSEWTDKLQARYSESSTTPFVPVPPWVAQVVIVDAMFAINTNPLRQHKTVEQYAYLLFKQYAVPHFSRGTQEVHFVFDHPGRHQFNPKDCEHKRRYSKSDTEHTHIQLTPQSPIPRPWRQYLECRQCKRAIVETLGWIYLLTGKNHLRSHQVLALGGCFSGPSQDDGWIIKGGDLLPERSSDYQSDALEADTRVWRHATQTQYQRVLVYSPDTDVFNIGVAMAQAHTTDHYVVQINLLHATPRYIDINKLLLSFQCDPDLAPLPQSRIGNIMLQLYIVTGCDFISYFSGIGKATFLNVFFQHSEFICGRMSHGDLSQTDQSTIDSGFLSFVRLIGTAYFKKNLATVVSKLGFETPNQLFNSMKTELSNEDKHKEWYLAIKRVIRVLSEDQRPPTLTALRRHWIRSCWIKEMWANSSRPNLYHGLAPPETQGWLKDDSGYNIDWEAPETRQKIQATLDFLAKGCTCKTGCRTKRRSCQKNGRYCGAGCECKGCTNMKLSVPQQSELSDSEVDDPDTSDESDSSSEDLETEIITDMIYEY